MGFLIQLVLGQFYGRIGLGWALWACGKIQATLTLPTAVNLTRRKVLNDDKCSVCTREPESTIHALWDCAAVRDIWAGSSRKLQKARHGQPDMIHLMEELLEQLNQDELELF